MHGPGGQKKKKKKENRLLPPMSCRQILRKKSYLDMPLMSCTQDTFLSCLWHFITRFHDSESPCQIHPCSWAQTDSSGVWCVCVSNYVCRMYSLQLIRGGKNPKNTKKLFSPFKNSYASYFIVFPSRYFMSSSLFLQSQDCSVWNTV